MSEPTFRSDELVVAVSHLDAVVAELTQWGTRILRIERSERLGLALVGFAAAPAAEWVQQHWDELTVRGPAAELTAQLPGHRLDQVVAGLRRRFRRDWHWEPTLGKNRDVASFCGHHRYDDRSAADPQYKIVIGKVHASYKIVIGGDDLPELVAPERSTLRVREGAAGRGVTVGVIDTGVLEHPYLRGAYLADPDALLRLPAAGPVRAEGTDLAQRHGTFVAGLVLQRAPGATLRMVRGLSGDEGTTTTWQLAQDMVATADAGAEVLNLSLACFTDDDRPPLVLQQAVDVLGARVVVVAAAGNYAPGVGRPRPSWPAALESVVAVGADTAAGSPADFSPEAPWVDVRTRGVDVLSCYGGGEGSEARWSGTSFAAASVAGALAAAAAEHGLSAAEVWQRVRADDADVGLGRALVGVRRSDGGRR